MGSESAGLRYRTNTTWKAYLKSHQQALLSSLQAAEVDSKISKQPNGLTLHHGSERQGIVFVATSATQLDYYKRLIPPTLQHTERSMAQ